MITDDTVAQLESLDPAFLPLAWSFVAYWRSQGVPLVVIGGRRTIVRNRDVGGAVDSLHLAGRAIDVSIVWPGYGHLPREWIPFWWWERLAQPWEAAGGRWGGRFTSQDVNHFDSGRATLSA